MIIPQGTRQKSSRNFGIRLPDTTFCFLSGIILDMHYVYLIQNTATYEKYIGQTKDINHRLSDHNSGLQKATRRNHGKWKIIYLEIFRAKQDAIIRERKLKNNSRGRQELYKRISNSELKK